MSGRHSQQGINVGAESHAGIIIGQIDQVLITPGPPRRTGICISPSESEDSSMQRSNILSISASARPGRRLDVTLRPDGTESGILCGGGAWKSPLVLCLGFPRDECGLY